MTSRIPIMAIALLFLVGNGFAEWEYEWPHAPMPVENGLDLYYGEGVDLLLICGWSPMDVYGWRYSFLGGPLHAYLRLTAPAGTEVLGWECHVNLTGEYYFMGVSVFGGEHTNSGSGTDFVVEYQEPLVLENGEFVLVDISLFVVPEWETVRFDIGPSISSPLETPTYRTGEGETVVLRTPFSEEDGHYGRPVAVLNADIRWTEATPADATTWGSVKAMYR